MSLHNRIRKSPPITASETAPTLKECKEKAPLKVVLALESKLIIFSKAELYDNNITKPLGQET